MISACPSAGTTASASGSDALRSGTRRGTDLLVAATAHAHGARLYTRSARGFGGLRGLVNVIAA